MARCKICVKDTHIPPHGITAPNTPLGKDQNIKSIYLKLASVSFQK